MENEQNKEKKMVSKKIDRDQKDKGSILIQIYYQFYFLLFPKI